MLVPIISRDTPSGEDYTPPSTFPIGPFTKHPANPILTPDPNIEFESAYLYNATAIVVDNKVFLLYRAQNSAKTSSIGIAWSEDGVHFEKFKRPILSPTEWYEMGGGVEDPRIVRDPETKLFIMTYTGYDRYRARLCVAVSEDLFTWKKYPPFISAEWHDIEVTSYGERNIRPEWTKSGAVFTERNKNGKYYMIWGDSELHLAESDDLIHWALPSYSLIHNTFAKSVFPHESRLIESGPAPIKMKSGQYIFIYNASTTGDGHLERDTYSISQMLIDYDKIVDGPVARLEKPVIVPEANNEKNGQVNKVVFCEGLVQFHNQWFLYYGQGDSELGVATAPVT
ncbi:uncharacterized protein SPAPADRAFT_59516 [Spathaspora passalidarum NRRL Y-27907]|uniref:Glycosidase n=1 Tax=Spathaspora passalidarum (strain NRRL Y-27907 / 11-Y1) TaxID=619300 RepID=G3AHD0_SPAPN|nr:uncharacterized protein SPAPADRAFT_59516 [Spathaspora passalidarum NRRL Y-27907]EGW34094.1 hypothetical protein SPAPADRAFT_59516 [Spathaspora passalidarum NRRL Y-27907]